MFFVVQVARNELIKQSITIVCYNEVNCCKADIDTANTPYALWRPHYSLDKEIIDQGKKDILPIRKFSLIMFKYAMYTFINLFAGLSIERQK